MDWNPITWFEHSTQNALQSIVLHFVLPIILFLLAFVTLIFARLPIIARIVLAAIMVLLGLYLGGWLPWLGG